MDHDVREAVPSGPDAATDTLAAAFADYPLSRHTISADEPAAGT
jgi:hypothetical protein